MSILINEAYANPEKPLWASAGSGGGGGSAPIVIFGNSSPVAWFNNFDSGSTIVSIQSFTLPTFTTNGKIVVQANWTINSGGQDAIMYCRLDGSYEVVSDMTSIQASKGIYGQSLTMTFDYTSGIDDWSMTQQFEWDTGGSPVDVGGTATMSVIFYPTP